LHDLHLSHLALSLAALCTLCLVSNYTLLVFISLVEHAIGVGATWVLWLNPLAAHSNVSWKVMRLGVSAQRCSQLDTETAVIPGT